MLLAFVHMEKAAGQTVHTILQRNFGNRYCIVEPWRRSDRAFTAADYRRLRWLYPRLLSIGGHKVKPFCDLDQERPDISYFTLLRDPIKRCISHYQFQVQWWPGTVWKETVPFEQWLKGEKYHNFMTKKLAGRDDAEEAIRLLEERFLLVGLMERFDESMVMLRRCLKPWSLDMRYRRKNVAPSDSIKQQILNDADLRGRVEQINELDLQVYRYVVEQLYPRQQAEHGPGLEDEVGQFQATNRKPRFSLPLIMNRAKRNLLYKPALAACRIRNRD